MSDTIVTKANNGTYTQSLVPTKVGYNAAKLTTPVAPTANAYTSFVYIPLPAQLPGQIVLNAYVTVVIESGAGSRTVSMNRHAKSTTPYTSMTHNNKPATLSGATTHSVTQTGTTTTWVFDVTADMVAIAAGGAYYGFKFSSTYTSSWKMAGWGSATPPSLTVVMSEPSNTPVGLRPNGTTSLAKPVIQWTAPNGVISAQVQLDTVGGTFASPVFDSGTVATTVGEIDLATTAYGGLSNGASVIARLRQTTDAGVSAWSDVITITRATYGALTITGPSTPSTDPTPALTWTFASQARYQVTVTTNDAVIADSRLLAGAATAWAPPVGATVAGQALTYRLRTEDTVARTSSPGDPGYVEATTTITYTPGAATAVNTFTAAQDGVKPWVNLTWTRTAGVPDEYIVIRDSVIIDRFDGTSGGSPVLTYRDYTAKPNTAQAYTIRPVIAGAAGAAIAAVNVTPSVTGAWLVDTTSGEYFRHSGHANSPEYAEQTAIYVPVGGSKPIKRTFALRGLEGPVAGYMKDYDGRTLAQQEAALFTIKAATSDVLRHVAGDINIPVVASSLTILIDAAVSRPNQIVKNVGYTIAQVGELPFPEVVP